MPARMASWLLRLAVLAHAIALFATVFKTRQTQFGNVLFLELFDPRVGELFFGFRLEDPYLAAVAVEKVTVSLYLLAAVLVLFKPWWPVLLLLSGYALAESLSGTLFGGYRFNEWTVYSDTLRWGTPLALIVLLAFPRARMLNRWRVPLAMDVVRVLIAAVFFVHGLHAWLGNPGFIDLIIGTFGRTLDVQVSESTATAMMKVIAVVDFVVALAVLVLPTPVLMPQRWWRAPAPRGLVRRVIVPALLLWLALWGFITALSRLAALGFPLGWSQYPDLLVRASHYLAPLALWGLVSVTYRRAVDDGADAEAEGVFEAPHAEAAPEPRPIEPAGAES